MFRWSFPAFVYILDLIMMFAERNTDKFSESNQQQEQCVSSGRTETKLI